MPEQKGLSTEAEIKAALEELPGWKREGKAIARTYDLKGFKAAMAWACGWANPAPINNAINAGAVMHRPLWLLKMKPNSSISGDENRQNRMNSNCSVVHSRESGGHAGSFYVLST